MCGCLSSSPPLKAQTHVWAEDQTLRLTFKPALPPQVISGHQWGCNGATFCCNSAVSESHVTPWRNEVAIKLDTGKERDFLQSILGAAGEAGLCRPASSRRRGQKRWIVALQDNKPTILSHISSGGQHYTPLAARFIRHSNVLMHQNEAQSPLVSFDSTLVTAEEGRARPIVALQRRK